MNGVIAWLVFLLSKKGILDFPEVIFLVEVLRDLKEQVTNIFFENDFLQWWHMYRSPYTSLIFRFFPNDIFNRLSLVSMTSEQVIESFGFCCWSVGGFCGSACDKFWGGLSNYNACCLFFDFWFDLFWFLAVAGI